MKLGCQRRTTGTAGAAALGGSGTGVPRKSHMSSGACSDLTKGAFRSSRCSCWRPFSMETQSVQACLPSKVMEMALC